MGDVTFTAQTRFENNMRLELNQQKSLLYPRAIRRNVAGAEKTKLENLISNQKTRKKSERNGQVVHDTTGWDGVWVAAPEPDYLATLVDKQDKLLTGVDLQGGEVMAHSGAIARARDNAVIAGFFGDMITGKTGTTLNAFPAGNIVARDWKGADVAPAACGMNVAKLRRARRILARNYVDMQQKFYVALTSLQIEELTIDAKAINRDYADAVKPVWSEDGKFLLSLAGFEIIEIELANPLFDNAGDTLTTDGNADRKCPFWSADGIAVAEWEELFTRITEESQMHFSAQVYSRTQLVATRTDNNRCGYILCDE